MNETDNPRNERRRSSRGRRRRSGGGGDRSGQAQNGALPAKAPAPPQQNPPRQNKSPRPSGDRERQGRPRENAQPRSDNRKNDRGSGRQGRRQERGEPARAAPPAPAKERFSAPRIVPPTLPKPLCPRCGGPIEDLPSALNDKETGVPVHFDCVLARLSESETLSEGEKVVYLGGGRFGVVAFENPSDLKRFRVRKTIQWEEKDKRADWRRDVSDLYSST